MRRYSGHESGLYAPAGHVLANGTAYPAIFVPAATMYLCVRAGSRSSDEAKYFDSAPDVVYEALGMDPLGAHLWPLMDEEQRLWLIPSQLHGGQWLPDRWTATGADG